MEQTAVDWSRLHLHAIKGEMGKSVLEVNTFLAIEAGMFGEEERRVEERDVREKEDCDYSP